jgi:hypothetical protein
MYRPYLCCLLLLLAVLAGNAQSKTRRELRADTGKLYLRFNPFGVVDLFDGNVTLGAEFRFNDTWSATLDAGAILYSAYMPHSKRSTGILLRPGIRLYPTTWKDFTVDLQLHYKNVTYNIRDWVEKDVVASVASYEEYKVFRYKKEVIGGNIMVGFRDYFSRNRRFYIEWYMGLGIHFKKEAVRDEPNSRYERGFRMFNDEDGKYVLPAVPVGMRIVYLLR